MVEFIKLSPNDGIDIYDMLQEIPKDENGFLNGCNGLNYDDYLQWLIKSDNISNGIGLEDWMVPQNIYWLYIDGKPVGMGKLRIRLTDSLRADGGHCGYGIVSSQRNKGYGKILLKMIIKKAKELRIESILLTIENENTASIKTAISNGGVVEKVTDKKHYIWVDCNVC